MKSSESFTAAVNESADESQITTMQATLQGIILEDNYIKLDESFESMNDIKDAELNEEADDFMETHLAVNLELKVREQAKASCNTSRNNTKNVSQTTKKNQRSSPNMGRYHRLEIQQSTRKDRPGSKGRDKKHADQQSLACSSPEDL